MNWLFSSGSQSFIISPSSEYSGLISFGTDWFNLLAVQGTLKSLLQHHCSKASVFQHSALFMVQISHPYMTTGKTIVLSVWIFVSKVMSLLFNMVSRFDIPFLPRSSILSELSTMTHPSWVALHGMTHSFIELHKPLLHDTAVIHEGAVSPFP